MCLFCCLSNENFTGKLSHISSFHFNFVLGTKQSVFCLLYVRVLYDSVEVFEGWPEAAVWTSLKVCIAVRGQHSTSSNSIDFAHHPLAILLYYLSPRVPRLNFTVHNLLWMFPLFEIVSNFGGVAGHIMLAKTPPSQTSGVFSFVLVGFYLLPKDFVLLFRNTCTVSSFNTYFFSSLPCIFAWNLMNNSILKSCTCVYYCSCYTNFICPEFLKTG